jgi:predicted TIM-barrel fold metal-dependent hydrolase
VRAYNDFILDEWCAAAPDRLIPLVILPLWDVPLAVDEINRTASKGAKAISFPESPARLGLHSLHDRGWNPVFAATQDADVALCMHFGSSGMPPSSSDDAPQALWITTMGTNSMLAAADLMFSPVFYEFPRLRVALSEGGVGWIPYLLERADFVWDRHRYWTGIDIDTRPSDLFRQHIWGAFIDDNAGIAARNVIGVDRICWECDYPHSDSNWPNSRKGIEAALAEVPDDEALRIVEFNARELLRFDADLTAA